MVDISAQSQRPLQAAVRHGHGGHHCPTPLFSFLLMSFLLLMRSLYVCVCVWLLLVVCCVCVLDPTPIQQRIALQPGGMTVSWSTLGPISVQPIVKYGLSPRQLSDTASGWTENYDPSITWFHHVVLNGLLPSTQYFWQVASPVNVSSPVLNFTTAPPVGTDHPFTVSINGDMGLINEDATMDTLKSWVDRIDLFWHVGDLSYADDYLLLGMSYEQAQELWMNRMTDIWNSRPYMYCPGNHEATCNEVLPGLCPMGQRNFTSYRLRYRMPAVESSAINNMFFSFDYGKVHFISIDTEVDYPGSPEGPGTSMNCGPFGDQLGWLKQDLILANENRDQVPWIFVAGHRPYYSSSYSGTWPDSQQYFEPLFNEYGVDIVYWGHIHWYERFWPTGEKGQPESSYINPTAPIYMLPAAPGNVEGLTKGEIVSNYTAFLSNKVFGLGILTVINSTTLEWNFYQSDTRQKLDSITIVKNKRGKPRKQTETQR